MHEGAGLVLKEWSDFYVITGSAAAALTGLVFVVITLVAGDRSRTTSDGVSTFSTPTVVHFCAALLLSMILSAPWRSLAHLSILLAAAGVAGVAYALLLIYRMGYRLRHEVYEPEPDDWLWYAILPLAAYAATLAAALWLRTGATGALVALAAIVALLIFIGIRNAWDVVTYIAIKAVPGDGSTAAGGGPGASPAPETPKPLESASAEPASAEPSSSAREDGPHV